LSHISPKIRSLWIAAINKKAVQIAILVFLLGIIAALVYLFHDRESLERFGQYGYPGIFLVTLIGSSTIIFPVPHLIVVWLAGAELPFLLVGLVASIGSALGELSGYLLGYCGQGTVKIEQRKWYQRAERWMKRYGSATIFVFALTPLPFDLVGIASGALKFPLWKFILACWAGKLPMCILIAYLGSISVKYFFPSLF
jgi:membrane protein YqaA with SNARE-associated domain